MNRRPDTWHNQLWARHVCAHHASYLEAQEQDHPEHGCTLEKAVSEAKYILTLYEEDGTTTHDLYHGGGSRRDQLVAINEKKALKRFIERYEHPFIQFTAGEAAAIAHRMSLRDVFEEVFGDTDGLEHLAAAAPDRAAVLDQELERTHRVKVDPASELDRELLVDCIEGSTWLAVHSEESIFKQAACLRSLTTAARKIEQFFNLPNPIELPDG